MRRHTDDRPEISVIVPVYNAENDVAAAIGSLKGQTWQDFEAIVIDDGSTDASAARMADAIGADTRFHVIRQTNRGLSAARNAGLDRARGRLIAFLDSDDRYAPAFLFRMREELLRTGADWAACAIRLNYPDASSAVHSAIHGNASVEGLPQRSPYALDDWRKVVRHFPSAWNKLYHRRLVEDLRFDEGTYFEDHAFFLRAAARSDALLHIAEPLYLHTRDRPGQITGEDSDRVFEQFPVLDTVSDILANTDRPGGQQAFDCLAQRLLSERAWAIRDETRRIKFTCASREYLNRHGVASTETDTGADCSISVVISWPYNANSLRATISALAGQSLADFEVLMVVPSRILAATASSAFRNAGAGPFRVIVAGNSSSTVRLAAAIRQASGRYCTMLGAGNISHRDALARWVSVMDAQAADFGVSARLHLPQRTYFSGFGMRQVGIAELPRETAFRMATPLRRQMDRHVTGKIYRTACLLAILSGERAHSRDWAGLAAARAYAVWMPFPWVESDGDPIDARLTCRLRSRMRRVAISIRQRMAQRLAGLPQLG